MKHFLAKTEPDTYSYADLVRDKTGVWDGVRNHQAKRNLGSMAVGDLVLIQHTGSKPAVVGVARVTRAAFADPKDTAWLAVELQPAFALSAPVTLAAMRSDAELSSAAFLRNSRLSVAPVEAAAFRRIVRLGGQTAGQ